MTSLLIHGRMDMYLIKPSIVSHHLAITGNSKLAGLTFYYYLQFIVAEMPENSVSDVIEGMWKHTLP